MEKKILVKIAALQDCEIRLGRKLQKLLESLKQETMYSFVVTQLINIANNGHPMREQILASVFDDFVPKAPAKVLTELLQRVTSGQAPVQDQSPFYLADFALKNERQDILSAMLSAKDEYLVYIISQESFSDGELLRFIEQGQIPVDTILSKLPLFLSKVKDDATISKAVFEKLREYRFRAGANISLDELTNYLTLATSIQGVEQMDMCLTMLNVLVQLRDSPNARASVQRHCQNCLVDLKASSGTPESVQAIISVLLGQLIEGGLPKAQFDKLSREMMRYSNLRELVPALKILPTNEGLVTEKLSAIITDLLPAPRSKLNFQVYKQAFKTLQKQASADDFAETLIKFMQKRGDVTNLNRLLDFNSLDHLSDATTYYSVVKAIILNANLGNKASIDLALYLVFARQGGRNSLLELSLFTEFCMRMLDNRYFEMLKDLIEDYLANGKPTVAQTCHMVGLIRRIAQCEKTEYSTKLLELVQDILSLLDRKEFESLTTDECRLLQMCIGVLTDMVENSVLQFFITLSIFRRKYPKIAAKLQSLVRSGAYSYGFADFLASVRTELYDLNLDECFYAFTQRFAKMSEEEKDAYETCLQTNEIVFELLLPSRECGAQNQILRALAKLAFYLVDQGLRAKLAKEYFNNGDGKDQEESKKGDDKAAQAIEASLKEAQAAMWQNLMQICNARVLRDVSQDRVTVTTTQLLAELTRIDLKGRADGRQIRNIDLSKRLAEKASTIDEQIASAEKSAANATKNRMFGCVPKTLINIAKSVKTGQASADKLIEVALKAFQSLDNESLLKIGQDLATLCALGLDHGNQVANEMIQAIMARVGALDNELVVFGLKNKTEVLLQVPTMMHDVCFSLVKFYFKSQTAKVEQQLSEMITMALSGGNLDATASICKLIYSLNEDGQVEASSLSKFMTLCSSMNLSQLLSFDDTLSADAKVKFLLEKAKLLTWFNVKATTPTLAILSLLIEAQLASKKLNVGPYGTESAFTAPNLNTFIQSAKLRLRQAEQDPLVVQATALAFTFLLVAKTDSTAETYFSSLASETDRPELALLCALLRQPMQAAAQAEDGLTNFSGNLAAFTETIQTTN